VFCKIVNQDSKKLGKLSPFLRGIETHFLLKPPERLLNLQIARLKVSVAINDAHFPTPQRSQSTVPSSDTQNWADSPRVVTGLISWHDSPSSTQKSRVFRADLITASIRRRVYNGTTYEKPFQLSFVLPFWVLLRIIYTNLFKTKGCPSLHNGNVHWWEQRLTLQQVSSVMMNLD
jgi:hypothetical protein